VGSTPSHLVRELYAQGQEQDEGFGAQLDFKFRFGYKKSFFPQSYFLLLLCFFVTFFFPPTLTPHYEQLALYTTILTDERRVILSFSPSCALLTYFANINIYHHYFSFSLQIGQDGKGYRVSGCRTGWTWG
jgi:hypothetical protein